MPEDLPDRMPENMPEDMPDHMPEDMPDRMSNRMSEDMSDRMPEDLPVRKCINVMVGITRSKVILFNPISFFWRFCWFSECSLSSQGEITPRGSQKSTNIWLVGGFKDFFFSISKNGMSSHWRSPSFFKMRTLHHQPDDPTYHIYHIPKDSVSNLSNPTEIPLKNHIPHMMTCSSLTCLLMKL